MTLPLADLPPGAPATITVMNVGQDCRRRMAGMGLRPGVGIRIIRQSPLRGPLQVRVGHTDLILRRSEAARIEVTPLS